LCACAASPMLEKDVSFVNQHDSFLYCSESEKLTELFLGL
jgi:hypothetical protein